MNTNSSALNDSGSGIIQEAISITSCSRKEATHFVICHGQKIKFAININGGFRFIRSTVAAYNKKLALLLYCLPVIPLALLRLAGLGYFADVSCTPAIRHIFPADVNWNVLVGTYDCAQKLIFQCFSNPDTPCTYVKIGNHGSASQMETEIRFLQEKHPYQSFEIPRLRHSELISEGAPFNIQITDEFEGEKIPPILNEEIYRMTTEIAGEPTAINGELYTFSHGDFAPWNIRKNGGRYTVFDWEHCGLRPVGYDAAYFIIMSEVALHKSNFNKAFDKACRQIQQFAPELKLNRELILQEFARTTKALIF